MEQTSMTVHRFDRDINPAIGKVNVCLFCSEPFNHPNHIGYSPRFTDPAYLKAERKVARVEKSIRRNVR